MKLILASQGFTSAEIAESVAKLVGKPMSDVNVAIINEAYVGISPGMHDGWLVDELSLITKYMKGVVSFVSLRAYDIKEVTRRLELADLIYIVGGAQAVLPGLFRETGFDGLLSRLASTKVIMGTSAGASVLGAQIEDPKYWQDQYGESEKYLAKSALGLVDFNIIPHFGREDRPLRNAEKLIPLLSDNPFRLYGLNDSQAVIFDNDNIQFVGGEPIIFGKA